jgi:hypothetical protein
MNFFCRLNPPRPGFALTMTPEEGALMQEHAACWQEAMGGRGFSFDVHPMPFGVLRP